MTDDLIAACAALVELKDRIAPSVLPDPWLRWALPPCRQASYSFKLSTKETVNAHLVVSCTRRSLIRRPIDPVKASRLMDKSDEMVTDAFKTHDQTPHQVRIGNLPLWCACEGKNRVSWFKSADRSMHAFVTLIGFPEPLSMMLVRTWPHRTWRIAWGHDIADVPCVEALNVLLAYGVPVRRSCEIDLPALRRRKRAEHVA